MLSRGMPRTLLLAGMLLASPAGAQEDSLEPLLLFPAPGTSNVVLNPGLLLRIPGAGLDPSASPGGASLAGGLVVRDATGNLLGVGKLALRDVNSYCGGNCNPLDNAVEIATAPLMLAAAVSYEVLSQMGVCPAAQGTSVVCLLNEFRSIGRFETGSRVDVEAPIIHAASIDASTDVCAPRVSVQASDDSAAGDSIRFFVDALQPALFGPSFTLHGVYSRSGEMARLSLIPTDPSGNRGQPFALDVSACANPNDQQSDIPLRVSSDEAPDFHSGGTGCALHVAEPRSAASSAAAIAAALLIFASSVCRRCQRAPHR